MTQYEPAQDAASTARATAEAAGFPLPRARTGKELVHDFANFLFQWFSGHADCLDSALAVRMSTRTLSGKPVVVRRALKT